MATLDPRLFYEQALVGNGITHAFGVPDSCLKGFLAYLYATKKSPEHIVTASEGAAIGLAAGYYLSTMNLAVAYMQNSGLANSLNPLQSLAAKEVFGIPLLLVVGWRGRPGEHDEPEHLLAGPRTLETLESQGFPYEILPDTLEAVTSAVARLIKAAREGNTPVALVVPNHRFAAYSPERGQSNGLWQPPVTNVAKLTARTEDWRSSEGDLALSREHAIRIILKRLYPSDVTVSSVGGNSREIYMVRKENNEDLSRAFLSIGAMGHTYPLAYGVQIGHSKGRVICVEGDGSFLMHVGNVAVLAAQASDELIHVVIHNGIHCSTGSQPVPISTNNLLSLAGSLPYKQKFLVDSAEGLIQVFEWAEKSTLIVVVVNQHVSKDLPRPSEHPFELRDSFISHFT
ncbi:thiamine diphosphate-binding protein [Dactylonectria estremocensis]|uniref:Thiamine diphosphate-binding protein n=1 Tax=Dactylonectria estremocensis TaxID=1079267 RepID=A0A9P9IC06_9HYPO|nr:thiamine diphosphate-binding protein [Dactylonectria estremocensis]